MPFIMPVWRYGVTCLSSCRCGGMERQAFHHRHRHLHRHPSDMPFIMPVWRYGVTCLSSPSSSSSPPSARHDVHDSHDSLSGTVRVMTHLHNSCERACTEDPGVLHACCPTVYSVYYMRAAYSLPRVLHVCCLQSTACTTRVLPTLQRVLHALCLQSTVCTTRVLLQCRNGTTCSLQRILHTVYSVSACTTCCWCCVVQECNATT